MRISDWSSDVCSSDLGYRDAGYGRHRPGPDRHQVREGPHDAARAGRKGGEFGPAQAVQPQDDGHGPDHPEGPQPGEAHHVEPARSDEHTSELQSLMRISYAVFCLKIKHTNPQTPLFYQTPI